MACCHRTTYCQALRASVFTVCTVLLYGVLYVSLISLNWGLPSSEFARAQKKVFLRLGVWRERFFLFSSRVEESSYFGGVCVCAYYKTLQGICDHFSDVRFEHVISAEKA